MTLETTTTRNPSHIGRTWPVYLLVLVLLFFAFGTVWLIRATNVTRAQAVEQVRKDRVALVAACDKLGLKAQYEVTDEGGPDIWLDGSCVQP